MSLTETDSKIRQQEAELTLFYDGYCPLCVAEMNELTRLDEAGRLCLEDIQAPDFQSRYPHIDVVAADRKLHAQWQDGRMVYGLDVTYQAWKLVNAKRWIGLLRLPIVRWFADLGYLFFARYRYSISWLLTGQKRCESCALSTRTEQR